MSTVIGTIKAIIGQAWIVASDGTRRQATEGEQVMRGEQIVTEQGAVTVTLPNGKNLDLGRASHWGDDTTVTTSAESSPPQDLAAAQQAIAEGADPSQVLEATAAGNPVTSSATGEAGDGGEGHTHVVLDLTGQILDPTAGYPTDGIDATFPGPLEEETLLETDQDVNDTDDDPIITPEPPVPPVLPEASITIDAIAGDNIINMREAMQETTVVSGKTGHDVRPGDVVTVTVNGNHYQTTVQADGSWSVNVNTSDLLASGDVQASVTTRDDNGNEATASAQSSVGQAALNVEVDIDPIGGDGWINAEEAKAENTTITGTVGGDAKAGDVVHLEVNGKPYEAVVREDLTWSTEVKTADLLADPEVNGTITIKDKAGNEATAIDNEPVKIDTTINVVVTIDPVTGDDFLSFSETNKLPNEDSPSIKVTGTVTGEATTDDFVEVKVGDVTIKVPVQDDGEGNLFWEAEFTAENLMKNPEVSASITVQDEAGNIASDSTERPVTIETGNVITGNEYDNVLEGGEGTSDVIIADTQGFQQQPGQDYNIAFIVDSSGSVGAKDVEAIIKSLTQVFNTLSQNAQLDGSGEVNILLVDFDAQVNFAVSVNLTDKNALKTLTDALANMKSGGGTNYEDAFKTAANWFTEMGSDGAENLTYFITDGKPTYYQSNEISSIDVDGRQGSTTMLDLSTVDYKEGTAFSMNIDGVDRVVIDAAGNVYSWSTNRSGNWVSTKEGELYKNGKGGYEISTRAGNGSSTTNTTTSNSKSAFALLLLACDNVEAIGINNGISANDLEPYDSDGNVMAGIAADELANAILGGDDVQMAGAQDTVHGNAGNDILFGDMVLFGNSNGFAAIKEYVAGKLNVDASQLDVSHVSQYISEHPEEFDQSQNDGGKDVLFGGVGDDIIYGGGGDDILVGGSGDDVLFGGKGDDILIGDGFDSSAELASHMGTTVGDLTFDKVADYVVQNSDELGAMGSGNDILHGGEGDDILLGGGGNDILNGGLGDDILYGGTGNDTLTGGKGDDILTGGSGSDTFTWLKGDDGHDVIKDFNAEEGDRIDLSDLLGGITESLENYLQVIDDGKGNAVIEISTSGQIMNGANVSITVEGSSVADINSLLANPDNTSIII